MTPWRSAPIPPFKLILGSKLKKCSISHCLIHFVTSRGFKTQSFSFLKYSILGMNWYFGIFYGGPRFSWQNLWKSTTKVSLENSILWRLNRSNWEAGTTFVMRLSLLSLGNKIEPVTPVSRSQVKHLSVAPANRGAVMVTQFHVRILGWDGLAVNNEILSLQVWIHPRSRKHPCSSKEALNLCNWAPCQTAIV